MTYGKISIFIRINPRPPLVYVWCSLFVHMQSNIQNLYAGKCFLLPVDLLLYDSRHHICRYSIPHFANLQNNLFRAGLRALSIFVHTLYPLCVSLCLISGVLCVKVLSYMFFIKGNFCGFKCHFLACPVPISVIFHPLRVNVFCVVDIKIPVVVFWRERSQMARSAVVYGCSHLSHSPLLYGCGSKVTPYQFAAGAANVRGLSEGSGLRPNNPESPRRVLSLIYLICRIRAKIKAPESPGLMPLHYI